jgi:hypothetical protein
MLQFPGATQYYIAAATELLSNARTYTCGILPHLVLLPLIGKGKTV